MVKHKLYLKTGAPENQRRSPIGRRVFFSSAIIPSLRHQWQCCKYAVKSCPFGENNKRGEMRLLEFVTCGRPAALPEDSPPSPRQTDKAAPANPRLTEEEAVSGTPLSPTTCAYPDKRRRRPSHGSASPWRPSLVAISEDGTPAPAPAPAVCSKAGGRGGGSRTTRAKSTGRVLPRTTERADFRYYGVPTVVPAFAPTAFLF